jgi:hypothetical protein
MVSLLKKVTSKIVDIVNPPIINTLEQDVDDKPFSYFKFENQDNIHKKGLNGESKNTYGMKLPLFNSNSKKQNNSKILQLQNLSLLLSNSPPLKAGEIRSLINPNYDDIIEIKEEKIPKISKSKKNKSKLSDIISFISKYDFKYDLGDVIYQKELPYINKFKNDLNNIVLRDINSEKLIKANIDPHIKKIYKNLSMDNFEKEYKNHLVNLEKKDVENFQEKVINIDDLIANKNTDESDESLVDSNQDNYNMILSKKSLNGNNNKKTDEMGGVEIKLVKSEINNLDDLGEFQRDEDIIINSIEQIENQSLGMTQKIMDDYHKIPSLVSQRDEYSNQVIARDKTIKSLLDNIDLLKAENEANKEIAESAKKICNIQFSNVQEVQIYLAEIPNQIINLQKSSESWKNQYEEEKNLSGKKEERILELEINKHGLEQKVQLVEGENSNLKKSNYGLQKEFDQNTSYNDKIKGILFDSHKQMVNIYSTYLVNLQPEEKSNFMIEYQKNNGTDNSIVEMVKNINDPDVFAQKIENGDVDPTNCVKELGTFCEQILVYANDQKKLNDHQEDVLFELSGKVKSLYSNLDGLSNGSAQVDFDRQGSQQKKIANMN